MPDWKAIVLERIQALQLEPAAEASLVQEIAQHLEAKYEDLLGGGMTEAEALRSALDEIGDAEAVESGFRRAPRAARNEPPRAGEMRRGNWTQDLWRDLRYGFRTLGKNPGFTLFAVLTLSLGIGANITVFTLINTLFLNALPILDSTHVFGLNAVTSQTQSKANRPFTLSYPDLKDYQANTSVFESLAGYTPPRGVTWQGDAGAQGMFAELVTANYFTALGLHPARGRFFRKDEDEKPGAHPVVVVNYGAWQTRFGAGEIVGKILRINNIPFTVIGIAPPRFIGVNALFGPDLWIPAAMAEQLWPVGLAGSFCRLGEGLVSRNRPAAAGSDGGRSTGQCGRRRSKPGARVSGDESGQVSRRAHGARHCSCQYRHFIGTGVVRHSRIADRGWNRSGDCLFECGKSFAGALGNAAAGDGGSPRDWRQPRETGAPASDRERSSGVPGRIRRFSRGVRGTAAPVRYVADGGELHRAEDRRAGIGFCAGGFGGHRRVLRHCAGLENFATGGGGGAQR